MPGTRLKATLTKMSKKKGCQEAPSDLRTLGRKKSKRAAQGRNINTATHARRLHHFRGSSRTCTYRHSSLSSSTYNVPPAFHKCNFSHDCKHDNSRHSAVSAWEFRCSLQPQCLH